MTVQVSPDGSAITVAGRLDVHTVADVRSALHAAIEMGTGVLTLDLRGAEVMDATGVGVLIGAHRRAERAGRTLVLRAPSARLVRLLVSMRLHRILRLEHGDGTELVAGRAGSVETASVQAASLS